MKYKIDIKNFVPVNRTGSENDALAFLTYDTDDKALDQFKILRQKLININNWNKYSGKNPTEFFLHNDGEKPFYPKENDWVKIKIPGPGNKLGNGFDWVKIVKIQSMESDNFQAVLMVMKPHSCPENKDNGIAHFYTDAATSTFVLAQENNAVQFSVHGRDEIPNTKNLGLMNSLRNFFVAKGGIFGGSKIQWQHFAEEFIKN